MTDADVVEVAGLIHHRWSEAATILATVKDEKDDGSADWAEFHKERLMAAVDNEHKWLAIRNNFTNEHRAVINKAFGL